MKIYRTIKLNDEELAKIRNYYLSLTNVEINENPKSKHIDVVIKKNGIKIEIYFKGTILINSSDEELIINETNKIRKALGYKRFNAIGSDEVGTGDVFGPVVVCSAYVSTKDYELLEKLNVRDSKLMSDAEIIKIAPTLIENIKHQVIKISPEKYNKAIKQGFNMNSIKAMLHNKAFLKLTKEIQKEENNFKVILDQFCLPDKYFEYLENQDEIYKDIEFHTQAENMHLSVAVGAIIARYVFLKEIHNISQEVGYELPLGSQKTADYALQVLIQKHGIEILEKTAKTNFKNIRRII